LFSTRKVEKYNKKLFVFEFLDLFQGGFKTERERQLLVNFIKEHNKERNTFYVLEMDNKSMGMVSLKFNNINNNPTLDIDYLFVHNNYRKKKFEILGDKTISQFLLAFTIGVIAPKIKNLVKFRYISLYPDKQSKKLLQYYLKLIPNSFELKHNKESWILLKI